MEFGGQDDTFSRWVSVACAIPLMLSVAFELYSFFDGDWSFWSICAGCTALYFAYRCLFYAITSHRNINRDHC